METEDIRKKLMKKKKKKAKRTARDFLSTGSTTLNLACTGNPRRGFAKGKYYLIVGDSMSGKTFLSLTCLAEASINSNFDNYRFIYDNAEDGAMMDIGKFFGLGVLNRMESPAGDEEVPVFSSTIEEFYFHVDDATKQKKPFIYILDSMDSLSSEFEGDKFEEQKKAHRRGKEAAGSFGDGKAKINSANLRRLLAPLRKSGSILIIICQTRDKLGGFGFEKKTRSGGHALRFYASTEIWSSIKRKIQRNIKGKKRQLGVECNIQVRKSRESGRDRTIVVPIYHSFGIDDVGSCVDYLIEEGYWKQTGDKENKIITAPEFDFEGKKEKLIRHIEAEGMGQDLRSTVGDVWNEIEEACQVKRKRRYE